MCSQRTGYLVITPMCMQTGFYVPEDGLPRSVARGRSGFVAGRANEAPCRRHPRRRRQAKGRMVVLPYLSRAASYGSSPDSSCTSSELRPATTGSPGGRLCNSRTLAPTCRQHGVLQLISTCYNERENDGADKL